MWRFSEMNIQGAIMFPSVDIRGWDANEMTSKEAREFC